MPTQEFEFDGEIYFSNDDVESTDEDTEAFDRGFGSLLNTNIQLGVSYTLLGVTVLPVIKTVVTGSNCDFVYTKAQGTDHVIHLLDGNGNKVMLKLVQSEGECYSGWTTASFVHVEVLDSSEGVPITHRNKLHEEVIWYRDNDDQYKLVNSMGVTIVKIEVGRDKYYPSDWYTIDLKYFKLVSARFNPKSTVYVVVGDSGIGKSLLVSKFSNQSTVWDFDAGMPKEDKEFEVYVVGNNASKSEVLAYLDNLKDKYKLVRVALSDF